MPGAWHMIRQCARWWIAVGWPVVPSLRRQCGAATAARAGLQPGQLPAHPGAAQGRGALVAGDAARAVGHDRRQDRPARPGDHFPTCRSHGLARSVPAHPGRHLCAVASVASPTLRVSFKPRLRAARWEKCVRMPPFEQQFPQPRPSSACQRGYIRPTAHSGLARSEDLRISSAQRGSRERVQA